MRAAVLKLMSDKDWAVREQLGATLGELPKGSKEDAIAAYLEAHALDPVAMDAALSGIAGGEVAVLERLMQPTETPQRSTAITMIAATIVADSEDASVQALFDRAADDKRPAWQRSAMLKGAISE